MIFDQTSVGWIIYQPGAAWFDETVRLTWLLRDLTNDGVDDLLVLLEMKGTALEHWLPPYRLYLLDTSSGRYDTLDIEYPYDEVVLAEVAF